jgi:hypothetical protein
MFEIVDTQPQEAVIKVVGVGGCGGNAVDHMIDQVPTRSFSSAPVSPRVWARARIPRWASRPPSRIASASSR